MEIVYFEHFSSVRNDISNHGDIRFFLALWDRCNHEHPIGLILIQLPSGNPRHADTVAFYQMHLFISTPEKNKVGLDNGFTIHTAQNITLVLWHMHAPCRILFPAVQIERAKSRLIEFL